MIGLLISLTVSWLLLHFIEKKNLLVLGFLPVAKRFKQFGMGFLMAGFLCVLVQYLEATLKSSAWVLNEKITGHLILKSFWWDIKSVLTEELLFRGALLYILIQKMEARNAIVLSAVAFGVYHWFSYGVIGNVLAMILVFLGSALMGYAWALAYSKTGSIMLPFGLHLGWNFIHNTLFSKGPLGELILLSKGGNELTEWASLLNFVSGLLVVPLIMLLYVHYFAKQDNKLK